MRHSYDILPTASQFRAAQAMTPSDFEQNARKASTLLKAMANERRLLILCYLAQGEKSVGDLEEKLSLSQSALSQHLARLRRDGLVATRRAAQTIYYSLSGREATAIMETLHALYCEPLKAPVPPAPSEKVRV
jgi:ArsR family transcriptional regulator, virulence genes transcriptional regulator